MEEKPVETQRIELENTSDTTQAYLVPFDKPDAPGIPLTDFLTVGRDETCHLIIDDQFVSSRHARIEKRAHGHVVRDLQSRNGTFLNESRVTEAVLTPGDRVRFGESVYVYSDSPTESPSLISKNLAWNKELGRISTFARTEFPVLLSGPSGSGKEVLARAIHRQSARGRGPFVSINCSALSESLIESELFGHLKGSFTGATHDRKGAFESARGGTLFLDEIGDLPLSLQPKLLRALENNEIRPVGADKEVSTDVRIIAATHKNLPLQVKIGRFREDLFYRLNVCQLNPPSLTARMEDFDDLVYYFARQHKVRFSFNAIEKLKEHSWPGNVRELRNVVSRASAYYPGKHIMPEDLASILEKTSSVKGDGEMVPTSGTSGSIIKEIEREMIIRRLVANGGNQRRTAADLGLPKSTLHDRIKAYSIDIKSLTRSNVEEEV